MRRALVIAEERGLPTITEVIIGIDDFTGMFQEPLKEQLLHVAGHHGSNGIELDFYKIMPEAFCRNSKKLSARSRDASFAAAGISKSSQIWITLY
ncbi:MAG: hypothetical protein K6U80_15335 [Firmicutes bacterium]|nr:hypothetical protein [Bacillota bacterium]